MKRAALRSLGETKNPRAQARLLEVARTDTNPELRKTAIRVLSERGEAAVDDLLKLFDSEQSTGRQTYGVAIALGHQEHARRRQVVRGSEE